MCHTTHSAQEAFQGTLTTHRYMPLVQGSLNSEGAFQAAAPEQSDFDFYVFMRELDRHPGKCTNKLHWTHSKKLPARDLSQAPVPPAILQHLTALNLALSSQIPPLIQSVVDIEM